MSTQAPPPPFAIASDPIPPKPVWLKAKNAGGASSPPPLPGNDSELPAVVGGAEAEEPAFSGRTAPMATAGFVVSLLVHLAVLSILAFWMLQQPASLELIVDSSAVKDDPIAEVNVAPLKVEAAADPVEKQDNPLKSDAAVWVRKGGQPDSQLEVPIPGFAGAGPGAGGGGDGVGLFGTGREAKSFVYIVDCSGSMHIDGRFSRAVSELVTSIDNLQNDQRFYVIFYSSGTIPMFAVPNFVNARKPGKPGRGDGAKRLVPATDRFKREAQKWIYKIRVGGGTQPAEALRLAISLKPEMIYFLTDGEIPVETPDLVRAMNKTKIRVNTIALGYAGAGKPLKQIADENGGTYLFFNEQ